VLLVGVMVGGGYGDCPLLEQLLLVGVGVVVVGVKERGLWLVVLLQV
jgi:hypothetical protein